MKEKIRSMLLTLSGKRWWWMPDHVILSMILLVVWVVLLVSPFWLHIVCLVEAIVIEPDADIYYPNPIESLGYGVLIAFPSALYIMSHHCRKIRTRIFVRVFTIIVLACYLAGYILVIAFATQNSMGEETGPAPWSLVAESWYFGFLLFTMFFVPNWIVGGDKTMEDIKDVSWLRRPIS